jgi:uncharacterized protein (TIGR02246 family)
MRDDEQLIRDLISNWQELSAKGDLSQILNLMDEDVVFLVPGRPPMRGRDEFAAGFRQVVEKFRLESISDIQEIHVAGDWAYAWTHLAVTMTPLAEGSPVRRSGYTLTIFRKNERGSWLLFRDANLLVNA